MIKKQLLLSIEYTLNPGCLVGILIMVYDIPRKYIQIIVQFVIPKNTLNNRLGPFFRAQMAHVDIKVWENSSPVARFNAPIGKMNIKQVSWMPWTGAISLSYHPF